MLEEDNQLPLISLFLLVPLDPPLSSSAEMKESLRSSASTGFAFSQASQSAAMVYSKQELLQRNRGKTRIPADYVSYLE
ncbi:hypothetical protein WJE43_25265, partial [Salmonella enterica subsp. enterica serovar Corvallis]